MILTPPLRDLQEPWCWYWDANLLLLCHRCMASVPCLMSWNSQGSLQYLDFLNDLCNQDTVSPPHSWDPTSIQDGDL